MPDVKAILTKRLTKRFAVGTICFFYNTMKIEIILANNVKEAISKHSTLQEDELAEWVAGMSDDLEKIKKAFFNGDMMVDVVEIE